MHRLIATRRLVVDNLYLLCNRLAGLILIKKILLDLDSNFPTRVKF